MKGTIIEKLANTSHLSMLLGGKSVTLPVFYASVSSVKTSLPAVEYMKVLAVTKYPQFLVSAYDLYYSADRTRMTGLLRNAIDAGAIVLMDSGNYESYWREDARWTFNTYIGKLTDARYHLAFSFDNQTPPKSIAKNVGDVEERIVKTLQLAPRASIVPILHGKPSQLPAIAKEIIRRLQPLMIAVPERELGEGMIARVRTLACIRRTLNASGAYTPIHLLGTGNPLSLLLFSAYGADSFDGLDWCQTTVDHSTGFLFHFQQREFFGHQSPFCEAKELPYAQATLAHNLMFYDDWMNGIRHHTQTGRMDSLLAKHFTSEFLSALDHELGRA